MNSVKGRDAPGLRPVGPDEPAADLMGWLLKHVSVTLASDAALGGLRSSHYRVLRAVPREGVRISELGARVGMTTAGSGQFVKALEGSGHLRVDIDDADRRSRVVMRTPEGDRAVAAISRRLKRMEQAWVKHVGPGRYAEFRAVLADLVSQQ